MSSTTTQQSSAQDGSPGNEDQTNKLEQTASAQNEDSKSGTTQPAQVETGKAQFNALMRSMQKPADRKCFSMICTDGVYRVIRYLPGPTDQPSDYEIYDAKPMSPEMIKAYLDTRPWSQETEDQFRGADGRTIPQELVTRFALRIFKRQLT
jgi:hypothetical protein